MYNTSGMDTSISKCCRSVQYNILVSSLKLALHLKGTFNFIPYRGTIISYKHHTIPYAII